MILKTSVDRSLTSIKLCNVLNKLNISKLTLSVSTLQTRLHTFLTPQHRYFVVAGNEHAASSCLAGTPKKCTLLSVQLRFLG